MNITCGDPHKDNFDAFNVALRGLWAAIFYPYHLREAWVGTFRSLCARCASARKASMDLRTPDGQIHKGAGSEGRPMRMGRLGALVAQAGLMGASLGHAPHRHRRGGRRGRRRFTFTWQSTSSAT